MAAERDPVRERRLPVQEGLDEPVAGQEGAHGRVSRRQALGHGDHVGLVAIALGPEPVAEAPEGTYDLVGDQQYPVAVANLADTREVTRRRDEAAAGVLDRLEEHGGHRFGPLGFDAFGDLVGGPQTERFEVVAVHGGTEEVRVGHPGRTGDQRFEGLLDGLVTGYGKCPHRGAVVRDLAARWPWSAAADR